MFCCCCDLFNIYNHRPEPLIYLFYPDSWAYAIADDVVIPVWAYDSAYEVHPINLTIFPCHRYFAFFIDRISMPMMLKTNIFLREYAVMIITIHDLIILIWSDPATYVIMRTQVFYDIPIPLLLNWGIRNACFFETSNSVRVLIWSDPATYVMMRTQVFYDIPIPLLLNRGIRNAWFFETSNSVRI